MKKSLNNPETKKNAEKEISKALADIVKLAKEKVYDIIILDEILFCYSNGLVNYKQLKELADEKSENVELVFTGRGADKKLINLADQVSEVKNIKHPFENGINARKGIDF
jgi:cob(I)alamin adenosyltransferase